MTASRMRKVPCVCYLSSFKSPAQLYNHYRLGRKFSGICHQMASLAFIYFTKSNFGQGSALDPTLSLWRSPRPLSWLGRGYPFPISTPLNALMSTLGAFGTDWQAHFSDASAIYVRKNTFRPTFACQIWPWSVERDSGEVPYFKIWPNCGILAVFASHEWWWCVASSWILA